MSCSYAEGLSPYENKGKLGLPESVDKKDEFDRKVKQLSKWIEEASHVVIHTGAGISTAAGIPDFRGPNGVWTLEKKGIKPTVNISFDDAKPTPTHMAIVELVKQRKVHYVVSQNIDALHLRSGLSRKYLAELHGNMYVDQCSKCERQFVRKSATNSVGQKNLGTPCPYQGLRPCRGTLHDTILDWEHNLPQRDINLGDYNSSIADLSICLGTTLQINPSGMLPIYTKKYNQGKLVICNLSSTKHDKKADLVIRGYVDDILVGLMDHLGLTIPQYDEKQDPSCAQAEAYQVEWTPLASEVAKVKRRYEEKMREKKKRKVKPCVKEDADEMDTKKRKVKQEDVKEDRNKLNARKVKQEIKEDIEELETNETKVKQEKNGECQRNMEKRKCRNNSGRIKREVENKMEDDGVESNSEEDVCKQDTGKGRKDGDRSNRGLKKYIKDIESEEEGSEENESKEDNCKEDVNNEKGRARSNGTGSKKRDSGKNKAPSEVKDTIEDGDVEDEEVKSEENGSKEDNCKEDIENEKARQNGRESEKKNGGRKDKVKNKIDDADDESEDDLSEENLKHRIQNVIDLEKT